LLNRNWKFVIRESFSDVTKQLFNDSGLPEKELPMAGLEPARGFYGPNGF
jgi:hypothetical protein